MVRLGAPLLMKTDPELALYGRYVVSERLKAEGFEFEVPRLEEAVGGSPGMARMLRNLAS